MRHIKPMMVVALLILVSKANAQTNEFNLSDYRLPDLNYKELVTQFGLGGSNYSYTNPSGISSGKISNNSLSGNVNAAFYHYLNNSSRQKEEYVVFNFSPQFNYAKEDGDLDSKNNLINPGLSYQLTNRFYRDKMFIETDLNVDYKFTRYDLKRDYYLTFPPYKTIVEERPTTHYFAISVPIKLGTGRIEQVQDARQAVYIFDELAKIDRVKKDMSKEDILEFAQFISGLKKERFFDSRLRRMAQLEALDSFLVAHNYLLKSDAKYFTTLLDFWEYGSNYVRNSGNRLSFAVYPGYYYNYYRNTGYGWLYNGGKTRQSAFTVSGGLEYKHEKPINLYWQNTIEIGGYFGLMEIRQDSAGTNKKTESIPNMQIGYFQTISYYPNTRTNMYLTGSLQYINLFGKNDSDSDVIGFSGYGAKASLSYSAYYYLSPKLRLSMNSSLYYILQNSDDQIEMNFNNRNGSAFTLSDYNSYLDSATQYYKNQFVGTFNIGLTYSIF
jgi:hypothetical protein